MFKDAGIFLIVSALLTSSMLIATADYNEDQNIVFAQYPPDPSNQIDCFRSDNSKSGGLKSNMVIDDFWGVQHPIHEIG